jgi:cholesterol oxidase
MSSMRSGKGKGGSGAEVNGGVGLARGTPDRPYDYDWIVVGSGFGGAVSALRLSEKGYRVAVIEQGRRFQDHELPDGSLDLRDFLWAPRSGARGILRVVPYKDVTVLTGTGVGGGSLVYFNVSLRPPRRFYHDPQWGELDDWESVLAPHYAMAEQMLGVATVPFDDPADSALIEVAKEMGKPHGKVNTAVFYGEPGVTVEDPYFGGEGPPRRGCIRCGKCVLGCRYNAKNTLPRNYLYLAERRGAQILPDRMVTQVRPLAGVADGSLGYEVIYMGARRSRVKLTARGVIFSGGAIGTNELLRACKDSGALPRISDRLGRLFRTNSEAVMAATATDPRLDYTQRPQITGGIYPDDETTIQSMTPGPEGELFRLLFAQMTPKGRGRRRARSLAAKIVTHPRVPLTALRPGAWAQRTIMLLVMQTTDNRLQLRASRRPGGGLQTDKSSRAPNPTYIEAAHEVAARLAQKIGGTPLGFLGESAADIPATAHPMGGAVIGADETSGVIDRHQRVFGYENMLVCDGAAVPANAGVNPSLTIAAMTEHAMSHVPLKPGATHRPVEVHTPPPQPFITPDPGTSPVDAMA